MQHLPFLKFDDII